MERIDGGAIGPVTLYDALGKVLFDRSFSGPTAMFSTEGFPIGILYAHCLYEGSPVVQRLPVMAH